MICPVCKSELVENKYIGNVVCPSGLNDLGRTLYHSYSVFPKQRTLRYREFLNNFSSISIIVFISKGKTNISFNPNEPSHRINIDFDFEISLDDFCYETFVEKIKLYKLIE